MRNLKKFLALVLATLMVISAAATVSAYSDVADDNIYAAAIAALTEYGIVNGTNTELDTFSPDDDVVRYQMALMMARALEPDTEDWQNGMAIFEDVTEWYGAIAYAYMNGIVTGMDATHFEPKTGIKCRDALIMAVRALGYEVDVTLTPYWIGAYQTAAKIGLTNNLKVTDPAKTLTRAETAQVIYNMLKATPADGGATIEEKNFNAKGENNTTKAVITATANQSFTGASEKVVNAEYVTLQLLNADGTLGDGFYAKFADLGFDEDVKADDVIGYSVDLVNYNKGAFVKAAPNGAKVVLTSEVTLNDAKNKITVDGKTYWLVSEYTGSPLKNEIIVKTDDGKTASSRLDNVNKFLYKGTSIVSPKGEVLATKVDVTAANGETLYKLASADESKGYLLYTVSELLTVPEIAKAYDKYVTAEGYVDVKTIDGNRMITLFDDDNDGTYDRAITTPVYMSVFNAKTSDGKINFNGGAFESTEKNITVSDKTLTKGDIIVYTYNKQTKHVNVLGTVEMQYGTIDSIDLIADEAAKYTITISGTKYKFGGLNSTVTGADLVKTNPDELNKTDSIDKIVSKPALDYVNYNNFINTASIGATVKYYVYNGYVIYAESYDVEESFNLIAIKNMIDVDADGLLADIYVDGTIVEDAIISEVNQNGKTVKLSNLSQFAFSKLAYEFMDKAEGSIYKGIKLEDGTYRLGIDLYTKKTINTPAVTNSVKDKGFGMTKVTGLGDAIEFANGISDGTKTNRLITNDNTVFYLIDKDGKLDVVKTSGKDYTINLAQGAVVYADKVGFSGTAKGTATKIVVKGYDTVEGFGIKSTVNAVVYIPSNVNVGAGSYQINTAKNFGLDGEEGAFYFYMNIAVDLSDGATVSLYSANKLENGAFYEVDGNGVVLDPKTAKYQTKTVTVKNDSTYIVTDDQYIEIIDTKLNYIVDLSDKVSSLKFINANGKKAESKGNVKDALGAEPAYVEITYLVDKYGNAIDLGDGIFVMVIAPTTVKTLKTIEITINATDVPTTEFSVTVTARVDGKVDASKTFNAPGKYEFAFDSKSNDVTASEGFILKWDDTDTFSKAHIEVVPEE